MAKIAYGLVSTGIVDILEEAPEAPTTAVPMERPLRDALGEAQLALADGAADRARRLLDDLARAHPDRPEVYSLLADAQQRLGRWGEAVIALGRAAALDPLAGQTHYHLGFAAAHTGDLHRAREAWDTYLRLDDSGSDRVRRSPRGARARRGGRDAGRDGRGGPVSAATPAQVRQWSEEVAADPASLSFLPLAAAYREQGRRDAALKLCIRGLEKHPDNVEAHYLLGLLYREGGDTLKAFDEWDIALALDPEHAGLAPRDRTGGARARRPRGGRPPPGARAGDGRVRPGGAGRAGGRLGRVPRRPRPAAPPRPSRLQPLLRSPCRFRRPLPRSPRRLRRPLLRSPHRLRRRRRRRTSTPRRRSSRRSRRERGIVGAVLLDDQGFVLAGQMTVGGMDRAPEIAAVLSGASSEAGRALAHLGLGAWKGILVETPEAVVRLAPAGDGMIAVAGRREVPTGWTLRVAARARDAALRFLGAGGAA